jgi:hypothetical protein
MATTLPNYSELTPAYARAHTTKTAKQAKEDFLAGLDVVFATTGQYTSIRDVAPGTTVLLRYNRNMGVTSLKVTKAQIEKVQNPAEDLLAEARAEARFEKIYEGDQR